MAKAAPSPTGADAKVMGGNENESTPMEQRVPDRTSDVGEGPVMGENGAYRPARYKIGADVIREDR